MNDDQDNNQSDNGEDIEQTNTTTSNNQVSSVDNHKADENQSQPTRGDGSKRPKISWI